MQASEVLMISHSRLVQRMNRAKRMLAQAERKGYSALRYVLPARMDGEMAVVAQIQSVSDSKTWYPVAISVKDGELSGTDCSCRDFTDDKRVAPAMHREHRVCKHVALLMIIVKQRGLIPQVEAGVSEVLVESESTSVSIPEPTDKVPAVAETLVSDEAVPTSTPSQREMPFEAVEAMGENMAAAAPV